MIIYNVQLYVKEVNIEAVDNEQVDVYLKDVDPAQIVNEIGGKNLLEYIDFCDIQDYYLDKKGDDDDYTD